MLNMFTLQQKSLLFLLCCISIPTISSDRNFLDEQTNKKRLLDNSTNVGDSSQIVANKTRSFSESLGTRLGREHVIESLNSKYVATPSNSTITKNQIPKPINNNIPDIAPHQDDGKPVVPKKGVHFPDVDKESKEVKNVISEVKFNKTTNNNNGIDSNLKKIFNITDVKSIHSSNASIHKKPLITESDTDYIDVSITNSNVSKENVITADQIDPLITKKNDSKRADYIVPIVAVILSVPLVAILLSYMYKRSADWWQHRNYKRMDFLIEGMYHT